MKLSQRTIDDLIVLIVHAHRDMDFGGEGSYCTNGGGSDNEYDERDAMRAERAIAFLTKLINESLK